MNDIQIGFTLFVILVVAFLVWIFKDPFDGGEV